MKKKRGRPKLSRNEKINRVFRQLIEIERKLKILEKAKDTAPLPSLRNHIAFQIHAVSYKRDRLRLELDRLRKEAN